MRCTHERVMFMKTKILIQQGCVVLGALALYSSPQLLYAHGYVSMPESRGLLCKQGKNTQCGGIVYEPHSLEGKNGFPSRGPADGHIASASLDAFSELDQQSPTRWSKVNIPTGSNAFSWTFTVNHNTRSFRYFITKNGWNPSAPLTRQSFEAQAFCEVDGKLQKPPMQVTHTCNVPQTHQGHHIILAVWDIGDTANAFYNVIDANIGTGSPITAPPPPAPTPPVTAGVWADVGDINPVDDLQPNDRVKTRVFDTSGENPKLQTELVISAVADGKRNQWPRLLAEKINQEQQDLRAGIKSANGSITPTSGKNDIFAKGSSRITRVEIKIEAQPQVTPPQPPIKPTPNPTPTPPQPPQPPISPTPNPTPTPPQPPIKPTPTPTAPQPPANSSYDYVYPDNIKNYKAGTKVLGSDKKIYQCKPFPYTGWCTIHAPQYTPATGSHWNDAWTLLK